MIGVYGWSTKCRTVSPDSGLWLGLGNKSTLVQVKIVTLVKCRIVRVAYFGGSKYLTDLVTFLMNISSYVSHLTYFPLDSISWCIFFVY